MSSLRTPVTWRSIARPVVFRVLEAHPGSTEKEIRKALLKAYPFQDKEGRKYRIWLEEIRRQLNPESVEPKPMRVGLNRIKIGENQLSLF